MEQIRSLKICNIVIKYIVPFDIKLDLLKFVVKNVDYRVKRFNGAIVKDFGCCLLVFRNGRINVVGAKSEMQADNAIREFCDAVQQPGVNYEKTIVNLVASCDMEERIDLGSLQNKFPKYFQFFPEIYPAAYFKLPDMTAKVLVFHTGKLVFTGFKTNEDMNFVYDKLMHFLFSNKHS